MHQNEDQGKGGGEGRMDGNTPKERPLPRRIMTPARRRRLASRKSASELTSPEREGQELLKEMERKKAELKRILVEQGIDAFAEYRKNAPEEVIDLSEMELTGVILCGIQLDRAILRSIILSGSDLSGAYLKGVDLQGAIGVGTLLKGALMQGSDMRSALFTNADLSNTNLRGVDLRGAILVKTNLRNADLTGANLIEANLVGADIRGAKFGAALVTGMGLVPGTPFPPGAIGELAVNPLSLEEAVDDSQAE